MRQIHKRIHEEGTRAIIVALSIAIIVVVGLNLLWPHQTFWHVIVYVAFAIVFFLVVRFFRVPITRKTIILDNAVVSPADGIISADEVVMEDEYFHEKRRKLSIFMSIYNVHINFFPFDGTVTYYKYHPGKYLVAFKPKSSVDNEHNSIAIQDHQGREVLVRQIAGFVARRIVCDLEPGDASVVGEEFGMIRFGSRVDVFLPLDAEVDVHIGQVVRAKTSVLAMLKVESL